MTASTGFGAVGRALSHRNFLIFTLGTIPAYLGVWVQRIATGWLTWEMTESATWLGVIAFATMAPVIILAPIAGFIADRFDRLLISKITPCLSALHAATLVLFIYTDWMTIEILLSLSLYLGVTSAMYHPVRQSLIPSLVPLKDLPAAIGLSSTIWNAAAAAVLCIVAWALAMARRRTLVEALEVA